MQQVDLVWNDSNSKADKLKNHEMCLVFQCIVEQNCKATI